MSESGKARGQGDTIKPLEYTTELTPNDVLFGRGAPTFRHPGNVKFREIVTSRKAEYLATSRHGPKKKIANQVIHEILARDGRFLREVKTSAEARSLGISRGTQAWVLVSEGEINAKVKQALREGESTRQKSHEEGTNDSNLQHEYLYDTKYIDTAQSSLHSQAVNYRLDPLISVDATTDANERLPFLGRPDFTTEQLTNAYATATNQMYVANSLLGSTVASSNVGDDMVSTSQLPTPNSHLASTLSSDVSTSITQEQIDSLRAQLHNLLQDLLSKMQQLPFSHDQVTAILEQLQRGYINPTNRIDVEQTGNEYLLSEHQVVGSQAVIQPPEDRIIHQGAETEPIMSYQQEEWIHTWMETSRTILNSFQQSNILQTNPPELSNLVSQMLLNIMHNSNISGRTVAFNNGTPAELSSSSQNQDNSSVHQMLNGLSALSGLLPPYHEQLSIHDASQTARLQPDRASVTYSGQNSNEESDICKRNSENEQEHFQKLQKR
jgi:hypothetical protein